MNSNALSFSLINSWLEHQVKYTSIVGMQISVRNKAGELVFSQAYGLANKQTLQAYTPQHRGHISSQSKMYTALIALKLYEEGYLDLDKRIVDYLPTFLSHKDERFSQITIQNLLSNRAGISKDGRDASFWNAEMPFPNKEELIHEILSCKLIYEPNTETKYSNMGFSLLGLLCETITGISYSTLLKELLRENFENTFAFEEMNVSPCDKMAFGHSISLNENKRTVYPFISSNSMIPAVGIQSTTDEVTKFVHQAYVEGGLLSKPMHEKLLKSQWSVKNMTTERYGFGTQFTTWNKCDYVGHSGGYLGFSSQTRACLKTGYTVGVIVNSNDYITTNIIRSVFDALAFIPEFFTEDEEEKAIVSPVMFDKWGANIYLVSPKKAVSFALGSWDLFEDINELEIGSHGYYRSDSLRGYSSVGEPIYFIKEKGKIRFVKWGGFTYKTEEEFLLDNSKLYLDAENIE